MPTKDSSSNLKSLANNAQPTVVKTTTATPASKLSQEINGSAKIETRSLNLSEEFKCRVNELYDVFTNFEVRIGNFTF